MAAREYVTSGTVRGGRLKVRKWTQLVAEFRRWRDCEVVITIEKRHATRSLEQNAYMWSVVIDLISEHTGYTPDEVHEFLKAKFLPKKLVFADGNGEIVDELVIGGTTTRLNKIEFGEYLASIQQWAAETLDVIIPDPDPGWRDRETAA